MESRQYLIDAVIEKEKCRIEKLRSECEERLSEFPRGSLVIREANGRKYCYLRYRDGKRVITKYAGTESKIDDLRSVLAERENIVAQIKNLDAELDRIKKIKL